jgi:hypothetical protein
VLSAVPPTPGAAPATVLTTDGAICCVRAADSDLALQLD